MDLDKVEEEIVFLCVLLVEKDILIFLFIGCLSNLSNLSGIFGVLVIFDFFCSVYQEFQVLYIEVFDCIKKFEFEIGNEFFSEKIKFVIE